MAIPQDRPPDRERPRADNRNFAAMAALGIDVYAGEKTPDRLLLQGRRWTVPVPPRAASGHSPPRHAQAPALEVPVVLPLLVGAARRLATTATTDLTGRH
jgi:hypothetical protein